MKHLKHWKKIATGLTVLTSLVVGGSALFLQSASAASGQIYISPASSSVAQGKSITVSVRINPGTAVDTVEATVSFNPSQLSYTSVSYAGSPFSTQLPISTNSGSVTVSSGDLGGSVTTDSLVAQLTFSALVNSGSATLSLSGNAAKSGTYTNPSTVGGTVSFTGGTCPAGETGTPPNCTKPTSGGGGSTGGGSSGSKGGGSSSSGGGSSHSGSGSSGSGSKSGSGSSGSGSSGGPTSGTPVSIKNITVQYTQAAITVTSSSPTRVYIKFGLNGQLLSTTSESGFGTSHTISINPALLVPGQTYSYIVVSVNQQGVTTQSSVQTFQTPGFNISVGVYDKNHHPLKHKKVTLHSVAYTTTTDGNGIATFNNVAPGVHELIYTIGSKSYTQTVNVANNVKTVGDTQTAPLQNISVVYDFVQTNSILGQPWFIGLLVVIIALLVVLFVRRRQLQYAFNKPVPTMEEHIITVGGNNSAQKTVTTNPEPSAPIDKAPYPDKPQIGTTITPSDGNDKNDEAGK